jgi:hypothetical protein
MAERIAAEVDPEAFGVRGMWLFGSAKNGTAGPASDIDLLIHVDDDQRKRAALVTWLDGWSLCLSETNFLRTGLRTPGLLDVHFLSDEDFARGSSFAVKVKAVTDPARPLALRKASRV